MKTLSLRTIIYALLLLLLAQAGAFAGLLPGYVTLTEGHTDIAIGYEPDTGIQLGVGRDEDIPPAMYAPNEALLVAGANTETVLPADPAYAFIGTAPGAPIWVLPQDLEEQKLFLGFGAEDIEPGTFASWTPPGEATGEWLQIDLLDVSGPGQFSIWQSDGFGTPINQLSTVEGWNSIYHLSGGHQHYNWAFTAPGDYAVTFQATGFLGANQTLPVSNVGTYYFHVVPEPSSLTLAVASIVTGCALRRRAATARRRRRASWNSDHSRRVI